MQPPRALEIIMFWTSNHAYTRGAEREALTKKVWRTVRKESPKTFWAFFGWMGGLLFLTLLGISMVFVDETTDPMVYLTVSLVPFFAMLPAALITAFNVFNAFFKNHPEDFPRN